MRPSTAFLTAALLTACGVAGPRSHESLKESVLIFNEGVRWGRLQEVIPRVSPDHLDHFLEMHEAFGTEIQLSDYEIVNTTVDWKEKLAQVTVKITWYRNTEMVVFTTVLSQSWEEQGADWMMIAESYVSGEPF